MNILVVDDDPAIRGMLRSMIGRLGHTVLLADDGVYAVPILDAEPVDMVISDIDMPQMNGLDLARHIRSRESSSERYIYTVLISGRSRDSVATILDAGADDFISKPFDPSHLRARIRCAARIRDLEGQLRAANQVLTAQYDQIHGDLKQAERVQRLMMPKPVRFPGLNSESFWRPSAFISGDCFNVFEVGPGRYGFYLADVSGHGARAALIASGLLHSLTQDLLSTGFREDGPHSAAAVVDTLNHLHASAEGEAYFTLILGLVDQQRASLTLCQAGGMAPMLIRKTGEQRWLGDGGFPVGLVDTAVFDDIQVPLLPSDRIVLFSDGATESPVMIDDCLTLADLDDIACQLAQLPLEAFTRRFGTTVTEWPGRTEQTDDITILALEFLPTADGPDPTPQPIHTTTPLLV